MDLTVLLAHERWAGRLARALAQDDDLAEDIAQDARVSFWRRGPDDPARARSWLGTVIRNFARSHERAEAARRRAVEALSGEAEAIPSAEDLARRLEGHRLLATLVGELEEPFREAILLRYYEGMSGAEIARRLQCPAGTVRWRIKTALDQLRGRLDQRHGGRRQGWPALLAALQGGGLAAPTAAVGIGAVPRLVIAVRFVGAAAVLATAIALRAPGRATRLQRAS